MMPDDRRGAEADAIPPIEEAPANVHVIRGFGEDRIEPADLLESPLAERHVTARNVLSRLVIQHNLGRPSRRPVHALRAPGILAGTPARGAAGRPRRLQ